MNMTSLGQYIHNAIENYFIQLEGCEPVNLHKLVLKEVEISLFRFVIKQTGGNQSKAATILGISRGTLRKKLKEYGLE